MASREPHQLRYRCLSTACGLEFDAGTLDTKTAWKFCQVRIQRNLDILAGAIGVAVSKPLRVLP